LCNLANARSNLLPINDYAECETFTKQTRGQTQSGADQRDQEGRPFLAMGLITICTTSPKGWWGG